MVAVLQMLAAHQKQAMSYAGILSRYEREYRTCKISSCLGRLKKLDMVTYKAGMYYLTDKGKETVDHE